MGMYACYQMADKSGINKLIDSEDIFEEIEAMQAEDEDGVCDLDKLWDGLHYLLTGSPEFVENDLLSMAVFGDIPLLDEVTAAYILPDKVKEISAALNNIDIEAKLKKYSGKDFAAKDIYPAIWDEDPEDIKDELREAFCELRRFYSGAAADEKGVIVTIY